MRLTREQMIDRAVRKALYLCKSRSIPRRKLLRLWLRDGLPSVPSNGWAQDMAPLPIIRRVFQRLSLEHS